MKKTKDSWFFFALYSVVYLMLVVCAGGFLARKLQITEVWQATALTAGMLGCACFLFGILRALGVRFAVRRGRKSYVRKIPSFFCTEILPIVLLYAVTLGVRVLIAYYVPLEIGGDERLFADAGVVDSYYGNFRYNPFAILLVYRWLLRGACLIFGNTPLAVFALNTVIQLVVVLIGYLLLRVWGNRKAAITYGILWNVLPCCYAMLTAADAAVLYVAVWTLALFFVLGMCRQKKTGNSSCVMRCVCCVLCGLISGYLLIGHISYVLVFVSGVALLIQYSNARKRELLCYMIGWFVGVLAVLITGAVSYAAEWDFTSLMQGAEAYITAYVDLYLPHTTFMPLIQEQCGFPYTLIVIWMLSGGLMFWFYKNEQESLRLFAPVYIGGAVVYLFGLDWMMSGETALTGICILMMAVGFGMIMTLKNPLVKVDVQVASEAEVPDASEMVETEDSGSEELTENAVTNEEKEIKAEETKEEETTSAPVQFIENPLPLPKKHVRKEMDYQYEVPQDKMNYDVAVDDTDDFDI